MNFKKLHSHVGFRKKYNSIYCKREEIHKSYIFYVTNLSLEERMVTQDIRLGPQETKLLFSLETKKMSIFTFNDARNILKGTDSAVWNVIGGLKKKETITRNRKWKISPYPYKSRSRGILV